MMHHSRPRHRSLLLILTGVSIVFVTTTVLTTHDTVTQPAEKTIRQKKVDDSKDVAELEQRQQYVVRKPRKDPILSKRLAEMRNKYRNNLLKQKLAELVLTSSSTTTTESLPSAARHSAMRGLWCYLSRCKH